MDALGDDDPALSDSIRGGDGKSVVLSTVVLRGALMLALSALGLSACAPEVVRRPTQLIPEQSGNTIEIVETVSVSVGPGYTREIRRGSVWAKIGRSVEGEIFSPVDGVFTVEGAHIHEAHLVLDGERLVGFYLPVERAFARVPDGTETRLSVRRRQPLTIRRMLFTAVALLSLSGCATGAKYTEVVSTLPPLAPSQGRIYFYRPSTFGAGVQPDINLNGQKVGTAKPRGFYLVDRAPGNYEVTAATETEKKLTFTLEPGQERFVRLKVQMGVFVGRIVPELVDKAKAEGELKELSFISDPLK